MSPELTHPEELTPQIQPVGYTSDGQEYLIDPEGQIVVLETHVDGQGGDDTTQTELEEIERRQRQAGQDAEAQARAQQAEREEQEQEQRERFKLKKIIGTVAVIAIVSRFNSVREWMGKRGLQFLRRRPA